SELCVADRRVCRRSAKRGDGFGAFVSFASACGSGRGTAAKPFGDERTARASVCGKTSARYAARRRSSKSVAVSLAKRRPRRPHVRRFDDGASDGGDPETARRRVRKTSGKHYAWRFSRGRRTACGRDRGTCGGVKDRYDAYGHRRAFSAQICSARTRNAENRPARIKQ